MERIYLKDLKNYYGKEVDKQKKELTKIGNLIMEWIFMRKK